MTKKLLLMVAPVLAVAAFSVMPAMASAATTAYGTCEIGTPEENRRAPKVKRPSKPSKKVKKSKF